jgi:hypothetical protein
MGINFCADFPQSEAPGSTLEAGLNPEQFRLDQLKREQPEKKTA